LNHKIEVETNEIIEKTLNSSTLSATKSVSQLLKEPSSNLPSQLNTPVKVNTTLDSFARTETTPKKTIENNVVVSISPKTDKKVEPVNVQQQQQQDKTSPRILIDDNENNNSKSKSKKKSKGCACIIS
jgi:hypothetical protein